MEIAEFSPEHELAVIDLIVGIQRGEFSIDISAEQQPDLLEIPELYQTGAGNFWVALEGTRVVGTTSLLDIGDRQAALRKMFVHPDFRGPTTGTAHRLLETLLEWAQRHRLREIFLGTTPFFEAAHRFYEKHDFVEIERAALPRAFPIMEVDTKFYRRGVMSEEDA